MSDTYADYLAALDRQAAAFGRPGRGPHLLDQAELNLGATKKVVRPNYVDRPAPGEAVRLLDLNCDGQYGEGVTVTMGLFINDNELTHNSPNSALNAIASPITGIIEWGNGASTSYIEFDLPQPNRLLCDPFAWFTDDYPRSLITTPRQSGVTVSLAASSIRVYARNDANLVYTAATSLTIGTSYNDTTIDPTAFAFLGYGNSSGMVNGLLRKTVYLTSGGVAGSLGSAALTVNAAANFLSGATCGIPPFAKRVWFPRQGGTNDFWSGNCLAAAPINVRFDSNISSSTVSRHPLGMFSIPFNSEGLIEIPPSATSMTAFSDNQADLAYCVAAVFELVV